MLGEVKNGWLRVPYDGPEIAIIEMRVGNRWLDAYLDYDEAGHRTAQVPWAGRPIDVELRVRHAQPQPDPAADVGPTQAGTMGARGIDTVH